MAARLLSIVTVWTDAATCRILFTPIVFFFIQNAWKCRLLKWTANHRRGCILLKTKEFFPKCGNIYSFVRHGTLFAYYRSAHDIAKLTGKVFVDLWKLVVRPELQPLQGALPMPIMTIEKKQRLIQGGPSISSH